jgi:hypothetical protein
MILQGILPVNNQVVWMRLHDADQQFHKGAVTASGAKHSSLQPGYGFPSLRSRQAGWKSTSLRHDSFLTKEMCAALWDYSQ